VSARSSLDPQIVSALAGTTWVGRPFEVVDVLPSTNDAVFARAQAGAPAGLAIAGEAQTSGRGRRGRAFESASGLGLWVSVLLREPPDPADAARLSILIAVATAQAIERETALCPSLKWPNDVFLGERKVAGVLVEAKSMGPTMFVVAGIGINVHHRPDDFSPEIRETAGSLEQCAARAVDRNRLAASLFDEVEAVLEMDLAGRFDLPGEFDARDSLRGREVIVKSDGANPVTGCSLGVESDGRLRLRLPDGAFTTVRAGEVSLRSR
jgi:BirA family biotin operon repressor/biotin-[acetyl-CoA-carboxylase] ligase